MAPIGHCISTLRNGRAHNQYAGDGDKRQHEYCAQHRNEYGSSCHGYTSVISSRLIRTCRPASGEQDMTSASEGSVLVSP
jgi:hypothetical protein